MKKFKKIVLSLTSAYVFSLAIIAANAVSIRGMHQEVEPEALKKYKKY